MYNGTLNNNIVQTLAMSLSGQEPIPSHLSESGMCNKSSHYKKTLLKNTHKEWTLMRKHQLSTIEKKWWDKITESIIGYSLNNSNIPIPSLQYQMYDSLNNTTFRYGLRPGQAFVNGEYALNTILDDLYDPINVFQPMDIGTFFSIYNFNSPQNIVLAMNGMYDNFNNINLNRIFFKILQDALASNQRYEGIMKTSMISVNVTKPFQIGSLPS